MPSEQPVFVDARRRLVDWLRQQLIGPTTEQGGELITPPLDRYPTGVLHPVDGASGVDSASSDPANLDEALLDQEDDEDEGGDPDACRDAARTARRHRYVPPASVGFSFCVRGVVSLDIVASSAAYHREGDRDEQGRFVRPTFRREPLQASVERAESSLWTCEASSVSSASEGGLAGFRRQYAHHRYPRAFFGGHGVFDPAQVVVEDVVNVPQGRFVASVLE